MTKQELNRDVKRLSSEIYRRSFGNQSEYFNYLNDVAQKEFIRLHHAADDYTALSKDNIIRMVRINGIHRFIPIHQLHYKLSII